LTVVLERLRFWSVTHPGPHLDVLLALLTTGLAFLLATLAAPLFNDAPVPIFLAAVLVSAWLRGFWPGLLTTAVSTLTLVNFFDLSRASPLPHPEDTAFDLSLFVAVALLINGLTSGLRAAIARVEIAQRQIEAAGRARDDFVGAAAHDLRSPLAGIRMAAQLARSRLERRGGDPATLEAVGSGLADIEHESLRIVSLLDELLDVVHLEAGRPLPLHLMPTRLFDVVESQVTIHQSATDRHRFNVVAEADPTGTWDPQRIARVLDNLLSNAIKYSPGGGEITVTLLEDVSSDGKRVASIRVRDCGVGIPSADLGLVFERFFRARNVGRIAGSGLGLAGARAIAEQHGGTLSVESGEGIGSTFTLRLPLDPRESADA
jgi:signal transduction histidine kinase